MATHSSILAWRIPWTEESGLQSGVAESVMTEQQQLVVQQLKTLCSHHRVPGTGSHSLKQRVCVPQ